MAQGVFSGVSIRAADRLSGDGRIPLIFDVQERKPHAVALSAAYSTDLGISLSTTWSHRNLFGNAEQLNLTASGSGLGDSTTGLSYNFSAQFIKPLFLEPDQTLEFDLSANKQSLDAYDQMAETVAGFLRRKLTDRWTASAGLSLMYDDVLQQDIDRIYQLVALPLTASYDSTGILDVLRDPVDGLRASAAVTPTQSFGASNLTFVVLQASGSSYFDLGKDGRSVVALRGLVGTILGGSNLELPPDQRLYAGGSATVRGYAYQSIGPQFPGRRPRWRKVRRCRDRGVPSAHRRGLGWRSVCRRRAGQCQRCTLQRRGTCRRRSGRALLYADRRRSTRCGCAPDACTRRRRVRNLYRPGAGILMQRWRSLLMTGGRWLMGLLAVAGVLVLGLLYTAPGHSTLAWLIGNFSNGTVRVRGLRGNLPNTLHARSVEFSDVKGVWFRVEDLSLDWSALAALNNRFTIRRVTARRAIMLRMPQREKSTGESPQIDVDSLIVPRIEIAKPVIGRAALLRAQGSFHYTSVRQLRADLLVSRLDSTDRYRVHGTIDNDLVTGTASIVEGPRGILGALLGFPGLAPVNVDARAGGDRRTNTIVFHLSAGVLRALGSGTFSLADRRADLDFSATAPAMRPNADTAWQSLALDGHMRGAFDTPHVTGKLRIQDAKFAGMEIGQLSADLSGDQGALDLEGAAAGVRIPGGHPDLFAQAPVLVKAHADLQKATWPVTFSLSHPLAAISGSADSRGTKRVSADVIIPSLTPFAALEGEDVRGDAKLTFTLAETKDATAIALFGRLHMGGTSLVTRLLGGNASLSFAANIQGTDITNSRIALESAGLRAEAKGEFRERRLNYTANIVLPDLSRFAKTLSGTLSVSANVKGQPETAIINATGGADMASRGFGRQHIAIALQATGLPRTSFARFRASGNLDGSGISLNGDLVSGSRGKSAKLSADWKSLHAVADIALSQTGSGTGTGSLEVKRLADLATFAGSGLAGSLVATGNLKTQGRKSLLNVNARGSKLAASNVKLDTVTASGSVDDPFGKPSFAFTAAAEGIEVDGISGRGVASVGGPTDKLAVTLKSELRDRDGNPIHAQTSAIVDLLKRRVALQKLQADWREQTIALRSPANLDFAQGFAVDRIAASVGGGEIDIAGRISPKLALSVKARNITLKALHAFMPDVSADGTLTADSQLGGTLDAPTGTFSLQGRGLRALDYSERVVAPANLDAHGTLHGRTVALSATLTAGNSARLALSGDAALRPNEHMNLHLTGTADLATFNPILLASGRQARGALAIDMNFAGTPQAPLASGGAKITGGEVAGFCAGRAGPGDQCDDRRSGAQIANRQHHGARRAGNRQWQRDHRSRCAGISG